MRRTQRRNKDGSTVSYLALAHNEKVDGVSQTRVLVNLGREDRLDPAGLRRLISSLARHLGDDDPYAETAELPAPGLTVTSSRSLGGVWLLDGLWHQLGIDTALADILGPRKFTTDMERVLFALVANRALDPCSKLAAADWAVNNVAITGLDAMTEDQAYRGMDLLAEADTSAEVQEQVFFSVANLLNLEVDVLLFDTTSTYFEADPDVDDGGAPGFRRYGHSKDHRPDLPQIIIGLAVTKEGIPVRIGAGRATPQTCRCCPKCVMGCGTGNWAGSSPWSIAGSPRTRTWTICAVPAGTGSLGRRCVTVPVTPRRPWPGKAATQRSTITCASKKSPSPRRRGCGG